MKYKIVFAGVAVSLFLFSGCYTELKNPSVTHYDDEATTDQQKSDPAYEDSSFAYPQIENNYYFYNQPFYPRYGGWYRSRYNFPPSGFMIGFGYADPWYTDPWGYGPDWYWDPYWGWGYYGYWSGYNYLCSPYYGGYPYGHRPSYGNYGNTIAGRRPFGRRLEITPSNRNGSLTNGPRSYGTRNVSKPNLTNERRKRRMDTASGYSQKGSKFVAPPPSSHGGWAPRTPNGSGGRAGSPPPASGGNSGRRTRK
jgi:hypothetical protein